MTLDQNIRAALQDVVRPEGRLVPEPGAAPLLLRQGRRRVRRRRLLTGSGAVAAVAAVGVIVSVTGLINTSDSGSRPTPTLTQPARSPLQGIVLGTDRSNRIVLEDLAHPAQRRVLTISGLSGWATNPVGDWVVSYLPAGQPGPTYVGFIDRAGKFSPTGQRLSQSDDVSDLAVSPDGARLAYVLGNVGKAPVLRLVVAPMPGHSGSTRTWTLKDRYINEISSVSWAPDGRRLTYVAGTETGAGIGGAVASLDTLAPGNTVPATSVYDVKACNDSAVAWFGTTGRIGVVRECKPSNAAPGPHLIELNPATGAEVGPGTSLQGVGCGSTSLSSTADGTRVLVSECGSVSLVTSGRRISVPGNLLDAAWPGAGLPLPLPTTESSSAACPPATFVLPTIAPFPSGPASSAPSAVYQNLGVGSSVTVATGIGGRSVQLLRGVSDVDFAISAYSHGPESLKNLTVLGSPATLYPASDTGDTGPRIPFSTGDDRASNPCNRWELRGSNVTDEELIHYASTMDPG